MILKLTLSRIEDIITTIGSVSRAEPLGPVDRGPFLFLNKFAAMYDYLSAHGDCFYISYCDKLVEGVNSKLHPAEEEEWISEEDFRKYFKVNLTQLELHVSKIYQILFL